MLMYSAATMPHEPFWLVLQMSIALAPCTGSRLSIARAAPSQVTSCPGSSTTPSQSSSNCCDGGRASPLPSTLITSTAPGLVLKSQSLQSPCASVKPSPSSSTSVAPPHVGTPPVPPWPELPEPP